MIDFIKSQVSQVDFWHCLYSYSHPFLIFFQLYFLGPASHAGRFFPFLYSSLCKEGFPVLFSPLKYLLAGF